jgi:hypothetical protein
MEHAKSQGKPQGNLRDFRIDGAPQGGSSQNSEALKTALAENPKSSHGAKQQIKARVFQSPPLVSKHNPVARPLTAEVRPSAPQPKTQNISPQKSESRWSLADSGLTAEEENLWGTWKSDAATQTVDLNLSSSPTIELRSIDEIRDNSVQQRPISQENTNLQQIQTDEQSSTEAENFRLATENFGRFPWAVELAQSERRAERLGVVDYANGFQKHEILKLRTREFTARLHAAFREQVELFNESRKSTSHSIQLYKINNTAEDFMLFRNSVKLVVSGQQAGRILFAFNQFMGQIYNSQQPLPTAEINALWGPFEHLIWQHKGERVHIEDIVRYFITEFVKQSFR